MKERKAKGIKFLTIFLAAGLIPLIGVTLILGIYCTKLVDQEVGEGEVGKLKAAAYGLNEYFAYDVINNGYVDYDEYADHAYVESLQVADVELTLFKDDTRFLTSLKNADGTYNEGTKANADIYATVKAGNDYIGANVVIGGKKYFVYYTPIYADEAKTQFWGMAFAGVPMTVFETAVSKAVNGIILIAIISAVVLAVVLIVVAMRFSKTINQIVKNVTLFSHGNIGEKEKITSVCKDFDEIGIALDILQEQLSGAVRVIKGTSGELGEAVVKMDNISADNADGATQISGVVEQLATTAQSMAESVQNANAAIINMGEAIDNIAASSDNVSDKSHQMSEDNEAALKDMREVFASNERSVEAISQINEQTAECTEAVSSIRHAADIIADIAGQTNLLALNASIEAARAGESGKGFAVVADNIRVLAEQSDRSVQDIAKSVTDVINKVQKCADMAGDAKGLMEEQQKLVQSVSTGMEQLSAKVSEVAEEITMVSDEVKNLNTAKESVLGNITELSAISEENAASAEEVSVTIENIANGIAGTKDESELMRVMSDNLSEKIQFFNE